jgi:hypothetical protein
VLFFGTAISITAHPVPARLMEQSAGDRRSINILIVVIVVALASGGATPHERTGNINSLTS